MRFHIIVGTGIGRFGWFRLSFRFGGSIIIKYRKAQYCKCGQDAHNGSNGVTSDFGGLLRRGMGGGRNGGGTGIDGLKRGKGEGL